MLNLRCSVSPNSELNVAGLRVEGEPGDGDGAASGYLTAHSEGHLTFVSDLDPIGCRVLRVHVEEKSVAGNNYNR